MKPWAALSYFLALCGAEHILWLQRHDFQQLALTDANSTVYQAWQTRSQTSTLYANRLLALEQLATSSLRSEELKDRRNLYYTAAVQIGAPPKEVQLILDTGSSDLWVSDRVYDPDESTTWSSEGQPVNMTYGIGFMSGVYGLDRVCLATMPQRTCINEQPVIYGMETRDIPNRIHGVLGLAFIGLSHVHHTFLRNLNESFADLAFAFALHGGDQKSLFTVGDYDEVLARGFQVTGIDKASVVRANVLSVFRVQGEAGPQAGWWLVKARVKATAPHLWKLRLSYFLLTLLHLILLLLCLFSLRSLGQRYCLARALSYFFVIFLILYFLQVLTAGNYDQTALACLDTGTSLISIPAGEFVRVTLGLFGTAVLEECFLNEGVELLCPCSLADSATALNIYFHEHLIRLEMSELFMKATTIHGEDFCLTGLSTSNQPIWILGDSFLRSVYAVHSFNRKEIAMFPYRPVSPVSLEAEAPIPLWAWLALWASMASLFYLAFLHFKKSESSREPLAGAVKVPLLRPELMSMSRI